MISPHEDQAGDLGHRAARRRTDLGLSLDQVATRAHMAPGYLDFLEHNPAQVTTEALWRLADALETSPTALLGQTRPTAAIEPDSRTLQTLDRKECLQLLKTEDIGRLVMQTAHGPLALPVNYTLLNEAIVFRTAPDTVPATAPGRDVGFEVDSLDDERYEGWSVLVQGKASRISNPATIWLLHNLVTTWAPGDRATFVRIDPQRITGRRLTGPQEH